MRKKRMSNKSRESSKSNSKKAIFFTLDAMLATGIIFIGFLLMPGLNMNKQTTTHLSYISQDFLNVLSELKINELNNTYVDYLISTGKITRVNDSLLEQIGQLWAENETEIAYNFTKIVTEGIIPEGYGYGIWIGNEMLYSRSSSNTTSMISSRKLISGYAKFLPVFGYTSRIYLSSIKSRTASAISYFGGFVGEGNITATIILPQNITNITDMTMEAIVGTDFKIYINNVFAGSFPQGYTNGSQIDPDTFDISPAYFSNLKSGVNNITIKFVYIDENFTAQGPNYIGGGFIKVIYTTPDTNDLDVTYLSGNLASKKYRFNGIDGFLNLYSSIYIPGNLSTMTIYLNLNSSYTTYLKIGNTTVYNNNPNGKTTVTISNSALSTNFTNNGVTFASLSEVTIPIRLGLDNVTRTSSPLDAVLATDVSGSMDWKMNTDTSGTSRTCSDPDLNLLTTKRISVAKCADNDFITTILANSGPFVGLVSYDTSTKSSVWLTNNTATLSAEINTYTPGSSTCICCGVNSAALMLVNDSQLTLISRKSIGWKYNDTNLGSDPINWTNATFKDTGWKTGQAALGNGYAGLNTIISKYEGYYYFRKKFNITNVTSINTSLVYLYSDSGADVYLNGKRIINDIGNRHTAKYWNAAEYINVSFFINGENTIAVKLRNQRSGGVLRNPAFDLELIATNKSALTQTKKKVMVVMTDGQTNTNCAEQNPSGDMDHDGSSNQPEDDAIKAACDAYNNYGITVYTVGFGLSVDNRTLQYMANCTGGQYFASTNYDQLRDTYLIIANSLISFTETQTANASGVNPTHIFSDSYIEFNYTPEVSQPAYGEITVTGETNAFGNSISQGTLYLPADNTLTELTATSYSADKWTDKVTISSASKGTNLIYNLSKFGNIYHYLGDAFNINIPTSKFGIGETNTITIATATSPTNATEGSNFDKLHYSVRINSLLGYGSVYPTKVGCKWSLQFYDDTNETVAIPSTYAGALNCTYSTPGNAVYNIDDALDNSAYALFTKLDFNLDGKIDIKLDENNLNVDSLSVSGVPSLWGPAIVEVRLW